MSGVLAVVALAFAACLSTAQGSDSVPDLGYGCDPYVIECLSNCALDEEAAKGLSCFLMRYISSRMTGGYTCISPNFMYDKQEVTVENFCSCEESSVESLGFTYDNHTVLITNSENCYRGYPVYFVEHKAVGFYFCAEDGSAPSHITISTAADLDCWLPYFDAAREVLRTCGIDDGTYICAECCYEGNCYDSCP